MVAVPDAMAAYQKGVIDLDGLKAIQLGMIAHCELMGNRVAILDAPPSLNAQQVKDWRMDQAGYDSKFAALYWPWIKVFDPASGENMLVPPSGHVAGICGRNDDTRGVHKAPANEVIRGAIDLEVNITKGEHDPLNPVGVNCIRSFPGPRHPRLGRPHAVERPGVALPQRAPAVQLPRGLDPQRHPVGGVRAQRRRAVGEGAPQHRRLPRQWSGARARCSG